MHEGRSPPTVPRTQPSPGDRPREKLDRAGPHALGDNELLAIVVGHGLPGLGAVEIADRLLASAGGVHGLTRMSRSELARQPGVGEVLASRVLAAIELGRRTLATHPAERRQFLSPRELARHLLPLYGAHPTERFGVVLLDARQRLLKTTVLAVGSLDASLVHPREVFREAVAVGAAFVAVFHNHPSGDPQPSPEDRRLTGRIQQAGLIMGIPLLDHIVLADTRYYSFKEMESP
jgi:DNA repair protein RadC